LFKLRSSLSLLSTIARVLVLVFTSVKALAFFSVDPPVFPNSFLGKVVKLDAFLADLFKSSAMKSAGTISGNWRSVVVLVLEIDLFSMNFLTIDAKFWSFLTLFALTIASVVLALEAPLEVAGEFLRKDLSLEEGLRSMEDEVEDWESNEL